MDAASLDKMNKLRKSLGLAPLNAPAGGATDSSSGPSFKPSSKKIDNDDSDSDSDDEDDGEVASTLETREAAGFENFRQVQEQERKRIEREKRKQAIQRDRELAARKTKLAGKGLGDLDDDGELDTKSWLKGQNKRQKNIATDRARRAEQEAAEKEKLAAVEYTSKDLAGVQVAHELGDFDDGIGEQILTLKDQEVGKDDSDDEGDMLENAEITAKDKLKEKKDLKKRIAYDVHDTEEKGLLSQYDDKKRKAFALDASGSGAAPDEREAKRQTVGDRLKDLVSLDILKQEPVSDYMEIKIKKPRKAKKNKRQKDVDDDDIFPVQRNGDAMDVDTAPLSGTTRAKKSETNFNDDEDLASALSFSRRAALKKQKKNAVDIVRQLKQEDNDQTPDAEAEQGIVVDDTTTFLDNLAARPTEEEPQKVHKSIERERSPQSEDSTSDTEMQEAIAVGENEEELLEKLRQEQVSTDTPEVPHTGLDEEESLDHGLGAALGMLRQRGLVKANDDSSDKNKLYRDRQNFIIEARMREHDAEVKARMQRERDRNSGKLANMSNREKEEHARWQNTQREHQTSIAAAAAFNKEYKPDVNLKYVDDDGRLMNQKEAFKHLSHKFHGKGSGKGKTEKHLKKIAEERRHESRSILDASEESRRGYEGAAQHQRKGGEAGVRLQ